MLTGVKLFIIALLVSPIPASSIRAQEVSTVERTKILATYGSVVWKTTPMELPIKQGVGDAIEVEQPGATTLRLHFNAVPSVPLQTWLVELLSPSDAVLSSYSPRSGENSFWSGEVRGPKVKVRVISTHGGPQRLVIDAVAFAQTPVKPQSITPPDDREPISTQNTETKTVGKAVARIRFIGDDGPQYVCTGFLISPDLFMTNQHCPQSESEWRSALVDFDFDTAAATPKTTTFTQFVMSNAELDMAIFRLSTKPAGRTPLQLDETMPSDNSALLLIQHPGGEHKQVSIINCRVSGVPVRGVSTNPTDLGHLCDTLGGSSGSTVINPTTKKVIGLHHLGFRSTDASLVNRAVLMQQIIRFIKTNRPDIAAEIGITQ